VGQLSAGPVNKAVPSSTNGLTRVHDGWRRTFWAFFSTPKSVHTYGVCTDL